MSNKIYKGRELLKAIEDGKIKYGTRFCMKYCEQPFLNHTVVFDERGIINEEGNFEGKDISINNLIKNEFEFMEYNIIDIENIEEMASDSVEDVTYFVNDLIKAVKQLNREIKRLKEDKQ